MKHVFLDSSVVLSFCASKTGASALILRYCREKKLKGHISLKVIAEVRKNTLLKMGDKAFQRFEYILKAGFLIVEPDPLPDAIEQCATVIRRKDAPVLAVAFNNPKIEYLLTLDKKDFLKPQVKQFVTPLIIVTPGELIQKYYKEA